jgi:hypothetical protein
MLGVLVLIVSTLFGCDYLFNGVFPANVSQETARLDLSSEISATAASTFNLAVVKSGSYEFVLLFSSSNFDSSKNHLYVLTPGLVVQNSFTMTAISDLTPASIPLKGNTAVAHLTDGKIIIGNVQATPGSNGLSLDGKLESGFNPISVELYNGAMVGPSTASYTWADFHTDSSNNLVYTQYASDWSSSVSQSHPIGRSYSFDRVFTDPEDDQVNTALLLFDENGNTNNSGTQYFLTVPKDPDLVTAFGGSSAASLFDNTAYSSFTMTELDTGHTFVVSDGIVSYSYQTQSLIHFTPTTTTSPVSLHTGTLSNDLVMAFSFSGGFYCTWDPSTRVLTRYEEWW